MIDPRSQFIIYKEQERERMQLIAWKLATQERGRYVETEPPLYFVTVHWLKENVFSRKSVIRRLHMAEKNTIGHPGE